MDYEEKSPKDGSDEIVQDVFGATLCCVSKVGRHIKRHVWQLRSRALRLKRDKVMPSLRIGGNHQPHLFEPGPCGQSNVGCLTHKTAALHLAFPPRNCQLLGISGLGAGLPEDWRPIPPLVAVSSSRTSLQNQGQLVPRQTKPLNPNTSATNSPTQRTALAQFLYHAP